MTAPSVDDLVGHTAIDRDGDKIGKIGQVYLDDQTQQPVWITVSTGLFGSNESFAPLYGATHVGDDLQLGVEKAQVKDAPNVDADGQLSEAEIDALYTHYAGYLQSGSGRTQQVDDRSDASVDGGRDGEFRGAGHDTSGPNTDDAMTRSEERLHVGTENVEAGRARLRKHVVTENISQTVPVSHEEVRVEREPITDANVGDALDGPALSEEEHEVTLHAERAVTSKETVPVERVRLATETVTEQQRVEEQVSHEEIDTVGVTDTDRTDR
ncbi:DUF2382 domain-containing protein [Jatrophihabitans sp. YIM 134969]